MVFVHPAGVTDGTLPTALGAQGCVRSSWLYLRQGSSEVFVDYQKEWLVDWADPSNPSRIYAKIINGRVELTQLGKGC